VFRNQQTEASAQKVRKEGMKSAKENVVNLKNRAMDLIELFLRSQQSRGIACVALLSALLQMARTTGVQQLANRATEMVKSYVQKAKGAKLPKVQSDKESREMISHCLEEVHKAVVEKDVSNALIDAAGQFNLLLCKLLIEAGDMRVKELVSEISLDVGSRPDVLRKALQNFWTRYDAWASSPNHREKTAQKPQTGGRASGEKNHHLES